MGKTLRRNDAHDGVVARALNVGLAQSGHGGADVEAEIVVNDAQEKMIMTLADVFGMSVRAVLNAAVRYTLHCAAVRGVAPSRLKGFPKRLNGRVVKFVLNPETLVRLREAQMIDHLPGCAISGVKLLFDKTMKIKS